MTHSMKIDKLRKKGFEALDKSLGPDGMIRFMHQFDSGSGDYTKERHKAQADYDVDSLYNELSKK